MSIIPWTEIQGFHNVRKFIKVDPGEWWRTKELLSGTSKVTYRSKVKLHGSNCAVQILMDGSIVCQSRTSIITPEDDYAGFAKWVKQNEAVWKDNQDNARTQVIVYGEWIGPGIQKGVAVSEIPKKCFAVFAARPLDSNNLPLEDELWTEPEILETVVAGIPDTYVLPWHSESLEIDWAAADDQLDAEVALINQWVMSVEANDPWVEKVFGIKGTGEGLVFYPVSEPHLGYENFVNLTFKAKGEKHRVIKAKEAVQVNPDVAANVDQFVELVLTEARLEQGLLVINPNIQQSGFNIDKSLTGKFVAWVWEDVQKETNDEREASGLKWEQLNKAITTKARTWYLDKAKK